MPAKQYRVQVRTFFIILFRFFFQLLFCLGSELYTEVGIHHYSAPPGFCFDINCSDEPIMDNPDLHDYNKDERIDRFLEIARDDFSKFKEGPANKHLIYQMGEDFQVVIHTYTYARGKSLLESWGTTFLPN